jgi:N-dimethylarginine dimethylaminohydrolase
VLTTERGVVILQTGKPARRGEGPAFEDALQNWDVPILGRIDGEATAEGGDMLWLDRHTLLVARGFRTNATGIARLRALLLPLDVQVVSFDIPFWHGPREVLHLQSFISLLDDNLALVYRRLLPVAMFELLSKKGIQLIDVPDSEYDSLGCNVLAIAPRTTVMVAGNPITRSRMETAGCQVSEFDGSEICIPGSGGPTCLTRPLLRG